MTASCSDMVGRFQKALAEASEPMALLGADGILGVNGALAALLGAAPETFVGAPVSRVAPGLSVLDRAASADGWARGPVLIASADGPRTAQALIVRAEQNARTLLFTDVERPPAEDPGWLRTVFDEAPNAMALLTLDGAYLDVNRAWCQLLGYEREEALHLSYRDVTHPEDGGARASRRPSGSASADGTWRRLVHKSGAEVWVEVHGAIVRDAAGVPSCAITQIQDVTERRRTMLALRESEARFRASFDQAPWGAALLTPSGRILQANPVLCRYVGEPEQALAGRLFGDILPPPHRDVFAQQVAVLRGGQAECTELEADVDTREGRRAWRIQVAPVTDARGEALFLLSQVQDISEARARAEVQRDLSEQLRVSQRMEAIGRLAGGIAHDFNNMLSVILSYATLARRRAGDDAPVRNDLDAVIGAAKRSAALARQLLIFGRRDLVADEVIELGAVLRDMEPLLRRTLGDDLTLDLSLDPEAGRVRLARTHAEQILMNLAVNAREAMPQGGALRVTTRSEVTPSGGAGVVLLVEDTGEGIAQTALEHIFEPFYTTKKLGSGLGLSIVYGIVRDAAGTIRVQSEVGAGTRFEIRLPTTETTLSPASEAPAPAAGPSAGEAILVVEDEELILDVVDAALTDAGYEVHAFGRPEAALTWLRGYTGPIRLLLTDVMMPGINGDELAVRVRALRPDLPVLFMSGHTDDRVRNYRAKHDPEAGFLQKPFDLDTLLGVVRQRITEAA